jgi:hypothetical protein
MTMWCKGTRMVGDRLSTYIMLVIPVKTGIQCVYISLDSRLRGNDNRVRGNDNRVRGNDNRVRGKDNRVRGKDNRVCGNDNRVCGNDDGMGGNENCVCYFIIDSSIV